MGIEGEDFGDSIGEGDGDEAGGEGQGTAEGGGEGHGSGENAGEGCEAEVEVSGEEYVCEVQETELIAGQHTDTGSVSVTNDADDLLISVDADAPYLLAEVHIYAGTDPVPTNNGGNPAPGQFPYTIEFPEPVPSYDLAIALDELGVGCDDDLNVAVHATVVSFDREGNEIFEETAWGFGDETFEGSRWGWHFDYGICCELPPEEGEGCTLTQGYWQTHNSEAEAPGLQDEWPLAEDTQLCGLSWLDILHTEPEGDAWVILAHQYIAASLNQASGASSTAEVDAALADAADFLDACAISDADRDEALAASELLDAYNNGEVGPGHCG